MHLQSMRGHEMPRRERGGQPPKTPKTPKTPREAKQEERKLAPVRARISDQESGGPLSGHIVEWFDGKRKIAVTRTDAAGRITLPTSAASAAMESTALEARILRP